MGVARNGVAIGLGRDGAAVGAAFNGVKVHDEGGGGFNGNTTLVANTDGDPNLGDGYSGNFGTVDPVNFGYTNATIGLIVSAPNADQPAFSMGSVAPIGTNFWVSVDVSGPGIPTPLRFYRSQASFSGGVWRWEYATFPALAFTFQVGQSYNIEWDLG